MTSSRRRFKSGGYTEVFRTLKELVTSSGFLGTTLARRKSFVFVSTGLEIDNRLLRLSVGLLAACLILVLWSKGEPACDELLPRVVGLSSRYSFLFD